MVSEGNYNIETGSTINTEFSFPVKMYKKHIRANQYNFPNMIGRDSALFYLAANERPAPGELGFIPAPKDKIYLFTQFDDVLPDGPTYKVDSVTEHAADGLVILYKILAVRG